MALTCEIESHTIPGHEDVMKLRCLILVMNSMLTRVMNSMLTRSSLAYGSQFDLKGSAVCYHEKRIVGVQLTRLLSWEKTMIVATDYWLSHLSV